MQKPMPVAVTNIAGNITHQPAYMTIVLNDHKYSTARKKTPFILKALNEGAAAHGRLTITPSRLSLADERGQVFQTLAPTSATITDVQLGLYRSIVRQLGNGVRMKARYTLAATLMTPSASYQLLNTDLAVIAPLIAWIKDYQLHLTDPLQLATSDLDWLNLTTAQFEALTKGTKYFTWQQTIGAHW
ncbi:hypothetical protein [Lactiplantibacillus pentosus]|uniref:DUF2479 domain-containing protein n=1 Tax=Lactiplantibacillus pentosus TaxID=1589 RepID=A0AAW8W0Z9_LACPE|nr:hypothetical protein [Lactiplantibacillus pentosus]AUI79042.1 hypothetical protein BB562_10260 [Lactiplantibacillus pentosus]MBO9164053.1 hypothetical protein [Lactiplantibacillus pentosus]MBQ0836485.1 hypothetical protein [Lactiplantibacillus pentosus]MBU7463833.1 hypothetical protein [Lactiplantibacillus pentosus]MBU7473040.1 hypothetical protein [Lactiplantibacillus pentosus]